MLKVRHKARPRSVWWIAYRKHFLLEMNVPDTMSPPLRVLQWQLLKAICYSQRVAPSYISDCLLAHRELLPNNALQLCPAGILSRRGRKNRAHSHLGNLSSRKPTQSSWVALPFVRAYYLSPDSIPTAGFLFSPGLSCLAEGPSNDHP